MNGKKVMEFLVLRSAFTQRNVTSLLLVGLFFAAYVMSGGKITTQLPRIEDASTFGDASSGNTGQSNQRMTSEESQKILGLKSTEEQQARESTVNRRGRLFDPEFDTQEGKVDPEKLITVDTTNEKEELKLRKFERREHDSLAAIEERLKIKRNK